jgi:hypothetical protein
MPRFRYQPESSSCPKTDQDGAGRRRSGENRRVKSRALARSLHALPTRPVLTAGERLLRVSVTEYTVLSFCGSRSGGTASPSPNSGLHLGAFQGPTLSHLPLRQPDQPPNPAHSTGAGLAVLLNDRWPLHQFLSLRFRACDTGYQKGYAIATLLVSRP